MLELLAETNPRLIFSVALTIVVAAVLWWDRENVERQFILFYRRTDRGLQKIDQIASKFPRFWKAYGSLGVLTGLISILIALGMVLFTFYFMIDTGSTEGGPAMILPGLESETEWQAGATFVPVEYWVISIAVLMFVHEMSHAIIARAEGFEINSVGWLVLGILPGAFVEPKGENMLPGSEQEESGSHTIWEGGDWKSRLKVLCAGSFANYVTAALFLGLALGMTFAAAETTEDAVIGVQLFQGDEGIEYIATEEGPAYQAGMRNGTLYSIDGFEIESIEDIEASTVDLEIGQQIVLDTSEGEFTVEVSEGEVREIRESLEPYQAPLQWFTSMLLTVATLNFLIGLFNMVPIKPLDGGLSVETLITEFWGEENVKYLNKFSLVMWALLLGTIVVVLLGF